MVRRWGVAAVSAAFLAALAWTMAAGPAMAQDEGLVDKEPIIAKIPGILPVHRGDKVRFTADKAKLHLFNDEGRSYRV